MKTQIQRSQNTTSSESLSRLEKIVMMPTNSRAALSIVLVYEDGETREWARSVHDRVSAVAGAHDVRPTWWKLSNFFEPGVLAAAVSTAMRADVIVVAVRSEEGLPLPFYTWANNWMPHRLQGGGVLVALQGKTGGASARSGRVGNYLRAVARRGQLGFLLGRNKLAHAAPVPEGAQPLESGIADLNGHKINALLNGKRSGHAVRMTIR